jgi:hypothetical protein
MVHLLHLGVLAAALSTPGCSQSADSTPGAEAIDATLDLPSGEDVSAETNSVATDGSAPFDALGDGALTGDAPSQDRTADSPDVRDASTPDVGDALGDGSPCPCIVFDPQAGARPPVTTTLECFLIEAPWGSSYETYEVDPCAGLHPQPFFVGGYRIVSTYPEKNLIGVMSYGQTDSPTYEYFYDASSHVMVGAVRTSSWFGFDPLYCTHPTSGGYYLTVRAGVHPDCDFGPFGGSCPAATRSTICTPGRFDAGADVDATPLDALPADVSDGQAPPLDAIDASTGNAGSDVADSSAETSL